MKNFDAFFNEVVDNARVAAAAVSKQAARLYDASKHKFSAETIKRNIGKKLIELGKLTYKATTQNADLAEEIAVVVAEITELKQNLAIVEEHLADIQNKKICPECGTAVVKTSVFCNICGNKFEEPVEEEPVEEAAAETEEVVEAAAEETASADDIVVSAKEAVEEIAQEPEAE